MGLGNADRSVSSCSCARRACVRACMRASRTCARGGNMQQTACNMQHTTCNGRQPTCNMQRHATCNRQHTTCNGRQTTCNIQRHATCNRRHTTCNGRHTTCNMQQATADMQRPTHNMQPPAIPRVEGDARPMPCSAQRVAARRVRSSYPMPPCNRLQATRDTQRARAHTHRQSLNVSCDPATWCIRIERTYARRIRFA